MLMVNVTRIININPGGKRLTEGPNLRWINGAQNDRQTMGYNNRIEFPLIQDNQNLTLICRWL